MTNYHFHHKKTPPTTPPLCDAADAQALRLNPSQGPRLPTNSIGTLAYWPHTTPIHVNHQPCYSVNLLVTYQQEHQTYTYCQKAGPTLQFLTVPHREYKAPCDPILECRALIADELGTHKSFKRAFDRSLACAPQGHTVQIHSRNTGPQRATWWRLHLTPHAAQLLSNKLHALSCPCIPMLHTEMAQPQWEPLRTFIQANESDPHTSCVAHQIATLPIHTRSQKGGLPPLGSNPTDDESPILTPFMKQWHQRMCPNRNIVNECVLQDGKYLPPDVQPLIVAAARSLPNEQYDARRLQQILNLAKDRALQHGTTQVSARDVIEVAHQIKENPKNKTPVQDPPPQHYDALVEELEQCKARINEVVYRTSTHTKPTYRPRVLIACETTGTVASHFEMAGCEVATADLKPTEHATRLHYNGDARHIADLGFDLVIAHPPCTFLSNAGVKWLYHEPERWSSMREAAKLFRELYNSKAPFVAIENPVMHRYARQELNGLRSSQTIHPWQHGHGECKPTCLYIRGGLPPLVPTCTVIGRERRLHSLAPSANRGELRSRFFLGFAAAMAHQWTPILWHYRQQALGEARRPPLPQIIQQLNEQRQIQMSPVANTPTARLYASETETLTNVVAVAHPHHTETDTVWSLCPHGAVLVQGNDMALDELKPGITRCRREECVREAIAWHNEHTLTKDFIHSSQAGSPDPVYIAEHTQPPTLHAPYPIRRIQLKGGRWMVWVPRSQEHQNTGRYHWVPVATPLQDNIIKEVNRLRMLHSPMKGILHSEKTSTLQTPLTQVSEVPKLLGFDTNAYAKHRSHSTTPMWQMLRDTVHKATHECPTCGSKRDAQGNTRCTCLQDRPGLGTPILSHKTTSYKIKKWTTRPPIIAAAIVERSEAKTAEWLELKDAIAEAAAYGVAKTPFAGSKVYCAYIPDLVVIGTEDEDCHMVAAWVRHSLGDTGAGPSLIAASLAEKLPKNAVKRTPSRSHIKHGVSGADGKPLVILGTLSLVFHIGGRLYEHEFTVVEGGDLLILGNDFIAAHRGSINPRIQGDEPGFLELDHEVSRTRIRSPLLTTPVQSAPPSRYAPQNTRCMARHGGGRKGEKRSSSPEITAAPVVLEETKAIVKIAKIALIRKGLTANEVWIGIRRGEAEATPLADTCTPPITPVWPPQPRMILEQPDLPGGKMEPTTLTIQETACHTIQEELDMPPILKTQITRAISTDIPQRTMEIDSLGKIHHLHVWAIAIDATLSHEIRPTPSSSKEWVTTKWIPIPALIGGLKDKGLRLYAAATALAIRAMQTNPELQVAAAVVPTQPAAYTPPSSDTQEGGVNTQPTLHTQEGGVTEPTMPHTQEGGASTRETTPPKDDQTVLAPENNGYLASKGTSGLGELKPPVTLPCTSEDELLREHLITREHLLFANKPFRVPSRTERTLAVRLPKELVGHEGQLLIQPLPKRLGLETAPILVAASICKAEGDFIPLRILNVNHHDVFIAELAALATIEADIQELAAKDTHGEKHTWDTLSQAQKDIIKQADLDPDGILDEEDLRYARDMLASNITVFAPNPAAPGHTHLMEVEVELKPGSTPHRHAPARLGEVGHRIVQDVVDELEANGIVRKSHSPWASRVVIVAKKSGEPRVCVDLRDLNSKLLIQDVPLPRCDDSIRRLAGTPNWGGGQPPINFARVYSTIDLASGFFAMPVKEEHKERLAFVTERAKYEYNYLPFGIQSGPQYFVRLIEAALQGISHEIALPYIDDIATWGTGPTMKEAIKQMHERLNLIMERLRWAGLTAKAKKCRLYATTIEYLGHLITQKGVSMDPKKVQGVARIRPEDVNTLEAVRSFLGLTGYYRTFVKDFHLLSAPLTELTKSGVNVPYASQLPEARAAVEALKNALMTAPVLAAPRDDRQFIIHTDAATGHGIGGILLQKDDAEDGEHAAGPDRPIGYYGRRCNSAEKNYTVTECELLAVVETIKHFRPYLYGRHFKLITDHSALRWLQTMRDSVAGGISSRLTRWSLRLQEYKFDIEHKPGKAHHDADAISRLVSAVTPYSPHTAHDDPIVSLALTELHVSLQEHDGKRTLQTEATTTRNYTHAMRQARQTRRDAAHAVQNSEPPQVVAAVTTKATNSKPPQQKKREASTDTTLPAAVQAKVKAARDSIVASYTNCEVPHADTLRAEQGEDPESADLLAFMITGAIPDDTKRAAWIARQAPRCTIKHGLLQHRATIGDAELTRVWIPTKCREAFLHAYHDRLGHQSRDRMYTLMQRSIYWPGMSTAVADHVDQCHECAFSKRSARKDGATHLPQVGLYPFDLLIADVLHMKTTSSGNKKILIFADSLTRWVEAFPLKEEPTSEEVLEIFMTRIVCRYGTPRTIRSDCGSNLTSQLCNKIYELCGINLAQSTAYHHQSAGLVERFNHTLIEMTRASTTEGQEWDAHLPFLLFAYNATPHRITRESPACLLYGRDLRLPAHMNLAGPADTTTAAQLTEYGQRLYRRLQAAWHSALHYTYRAQKDNAERIDVRRFSNTTYSEGDRVLLKIETPQNKLHYTWTGPYRVAEALPRNVYRLRDLANSRIVDRVAVDRLRPYLTVTDAEPLAPDEHVVQELCAWRELNGRRQYKVKWRGFKSSDATWTDEENLLVRCADLVTAYNQQHGIADSTPTKSTKKRSKDDHAKDARTAATQRDIAQQREQTDKDAIWHTAPPATAPTELPALCDEPPPQKEIEAAQTATPEPNDTYPGRATSAKYVRGTWSYQTHFQSRRGRQPRWLPAHHFNATELKQLEPLRKIYLQDHPERAPLVTAHAQIPN